MILITIFLYLVGLSLVGLVGVFIFLKYLDWKQCNNFRKRGVPYIPANYGRLISFLRGKSSLVDIEMELYNDALKLKSPYVGLSDSMGPLYMIMDLDLTRNIYVKDSDHFVDRRKFTNKLDKIGNKMLIGLDGDEWKGMRSKLSPTFTTGKIRRMFSIFENSSQRMCQFLKNQLNSGNGQAEVDLCPAYSKYAIDVIASCAFGIDSQTFECDPKKPPIFERMAAQLTFKINFTAFLKFIIVYAAPKLAAWLGFQVFGGESQAYFERLIKGALEHRRKTGQRHDDFLQLMIDAQAGLLKGEENSGETLEVMTGTTEGGKSKGSSFAESGKNMKIDDDDIVANCVLFLIGGFDTTQSLLIYTAYQLAVEQECQEKLREEVNAAIEANQGKLTYDAVHGMAYLDMFVNETLRYLPPAARTERLCTQTYKIPVENGATIEKGSLVGLPVLAMQRDPRIYENPDKFDPERFLPERKSKMHPYSFAPFGHGPRNCIGMRFALTEVKTVIATLVHQFKLEPCAKTDIPPKFANVSALKPKNGMWLNVQPISTTEE